MMAVARLFAALGAMAFGLAPGHALAQATTQPVTIKVAYYKKHAWFGESLLEFNPDLSSRMVRFAPASFPTSIDTEIEHWWKQGKRASEFAFYFAGESPKFKLYRPQGGLEKLSYSEADRDAVAAHVIARTLEERAAAFMPRDETIATAACDAQAYILRAAKTKFQATVCQRLAEDRKASGSSKKKLK